jgi:hypothetical protein
VNTNHYEPFHGVDGFGMVYPQEEKPSSELIREKHAVVAMKEYIDKVRFTFESYQTFTFLSSLEPK